MHVHFITRAGKYVEFYRRGKTKPPVIEGSAQAAEKLTHLGMAVILTDDLGAEIRTNTESLPWQLVRLRTWYGWTHIGHFRTIKDAAAAARKTAAATRNK